MTSSICIGYHLTVSRRDGTVLYSAHLRGGPAHQALYEASRHLEVLPIIEPQYDIIIKLEGKSIND